MTKIHTIDLYFLLIVLISSPFAFCSDIRELSTLNGPTIARFDRPLEQLSLPKGRQYGIFRALEPTRKQNIVEQWRVEHLPGLGGKTGSLVLKYTVNDGYNGWWLKLAPDGKIADWSKFEKGHLIIRVLDAPRQFKVELKDRFLAIYPVVVRLRREHFEKINERGYVDIVIPLKSFRIPNMNGLRELVIVFESFRLAPEYSGELSMCEIGISNKPELTANADEILNDLRKRAFAWFMKYKHPTTGLVLDRGPNRENTHPNPQKPAMCSVASVGYFLSLLPEYVRLGYISHSQAQKQAIQTLTSVVEKVDEYEGMLYHFVDWRNGERWKQSEVGVLDHAICLNGAMTASMFFGGEIELLTNRLLDRVDWTKFIVTDARTNKQLLALGWSPEKGLLSPADVRSSEMAMAYFLAIGSKKAISPEYWYNTRVDYKKLFGHKLLNAQHPLFTSMYGMNWHHLEDRPDRQGIDLYKNARTAAIVNRKFCRETGKNELTYSLSEGGWYGISAGDSPSGYVAPGPIHGDADSVVWPLAALACLPWIPEELTNDLPAWRASQAWYLACGPYGISPFRLDKQPWVGSDLIGIDLGSFAVSLANYQNRTVWDLWNRHPVAQKALDKLRYADLEGSR